MEKTEKAVKPEINFDKAIFEAPITEELLLKYIRVYNSRQRQGTSSVKTRAEVRGGGAKPWKQKGTGRARQGSRRAPQWVHGGVAHGPKPQNWDLKLTKEMKKAALKSALSLKKKNKEIFTFDSFDPKATKIKDHLTQLQKLNLTGKSLVVVSEGEKSVIKFLRNAKDIKVETTQSLNVYDIMNSKNVVFTKDSLVDLKKRV